MTTYRNEELGVELIVYDGEGCELKSTRPRYESMLSDDSVNRWAEEAYRTHVTLNCSDYSI